MVVSAHIKGVFILCSVTLYMVHQFLTIDLWVYSSLSHSSFRLILRSVGIPLLASSVGVYNIYSLKQFLAMCLLQTKEPRQ